MRVVILLNEPMLPLEHPEAGSEHAILDTVEAVEWQLLERGFDVDRLQVGRNLAVVPVGLRNLGPDVVFNLFEGHADDPESEMAVADLLERTGVPFTGCPSAAIRISRDKHLAKGILRRSGLPSPQSIVIAELPVPEWHMNWPVIVKPVREHGSVGIDHGSVTTTQRDLERRVARVLRTYGSPVLVEQYIDGRELSVAVVETPRLRALPASEILFEPRGAGSWPIVTYDAKWNPDSADYQATPPKYPATVSCELACRLEDLARRAFRALGCRDYARVDFRVDSFGTPYILEVNANPDFHPEACLGGSLIAAAMNHAQLTVDTVRAAWSRRNLAAGRLTADTMCRNLPSMITNVRTLTLAKHRQYDPC